MGDISPRFSRREFACKDGCGFDTVDIELVNNLESLADNFLAQEQDHADPSKNAKQVIVHINSGNRCAEYDRALKIKNAQKAGIPFIDKPSKSQHRRYLYPGGERKKIDDDLIADELEMIYVARHGIGRYKGRTHYDIRANGPARWDNR